MLINRRQALGSAIVAAVLVACGGTQTSVTQLWKAPIAAPPMKSVIVFAANLDEANRRALEDAYVTALSAHGIIARPSYSLFPGEPPAREAAQRAVENAGVDGILVSRLRSVREKQTYVNGDYGGGFWSGYYGSGWGYWSPGYVQTDELVAFDTTLWDARIGDKLEFALTTQTKNPASDRDSVQSLTKTVVKALEDQKLLRQ
jgi:hypothetical protein